MVDERSIPSTSAEGINESVIPDSLGSVVPGTEMIKSSPPEMDISPVSDAVAGESDSFPSINAPEISSALDALRNEADKASDVFKGTTQGIASNLEENMQRVSSSLSAAASDLVGQSRGVMREIEIFENQVQGSINEKLNVVQQLSASLQEETSHFLERLPPPVSNAFSQVAATSEAIYKIIVEQPNLAGAVATIGILIPAVAIFNSAYGGYAGIFKPTKALQVLRMEDSLLVDVRSDRERAENGVPELRKGALGKGIAFPLQKVVPSLARRVRDPQALAIQVLGAQIASLIKLNKETKILILDNRGECAKEVARAVVSAGFRRVYIVEGGFKAWKRDNPILTEGSIGYIASPIDFLGDTAENVASEAASLVKKEPLNALAFSGLAFLGIFAILNYHLLMRYIGVLGLEASIALRVMQYQSPQDAVDDIKGLTGKVQGAATAPLRFFRSLPPNQQIEKVLPLQGQEKS